MRRYSLVVALASAGLGPALAQSAPADDIAIGEQVLGPASMLPDDIAKMSAADLIQANAGIRAGAARGFEEQGVSVAPTELDVSTERVVLAGRAVLKTRVQVPAKIFYYQYSGVSKGSAAIVVCVSKSARPFNPAGTECERRANATFAPGERG